jgi:hypothetical protein
MFVECVDVHSVVHISAWLVHLLVMALEVNVHRQIWIWSDCRLLIHDWYTNRDVFICCFIGALECDRQCRAEKSEKKIFGSEYWCFKLVVRSYVNLIPMRMIKMMEAVCVINRTAHPESPGNKREDINVPWKVVRAIGNWITWSSTSSPKLQFHSKVRLKAGHCFVVYL